MKSIQSEIVAAFKTVLSIFPSVFAWVRVTAYEAFARNLTLTLYEFFYKNVGENARILDVGVGPGTSLFHFNDIIRKKQCRVTGIDIDQHYFAKFLDTIKKDKMEDLVDGVLQSINDYNQTGFDYVFMSQSIMLVPDPIATLKHVQTLGKAGKKPVVVLALTVFKRTLFNKVLSWIKPHLKYWTTIEYGRMVYEDQIHVQVETSGMKVTKAHELYKTALGDSVMIYYCQTA